MSSSVHGMVDAIVVGAGIVGSACARELTLRGQRVEVLDTRDGPPPASHSGMGHLVTLAGDVQQMALIGRSQSLWRQLAAGLPDSAEFGPCGTLWLADDADQDQALDAMREALTRRDISCERLGGEAARSLESLLGPEVRGALRVPGDAVVYQPVVSQWLLDDAVSHGAIVQRGAPAIGIESGAVHLADGGERRAALVFNAVGLAAPTLHADLPPSVRIDARKGHLMVSSRGAARCRHHLVEAGYTSGAAGHESDAVAFNLQPRPGDQVLLGSSRQQGVRDRRTEPQILRRMLDRARRFVPSIDELPIIRAWTGLRPATPDERPFIGPVPGQPGVFMVAGHEGLGITTSLGSAELAVDLALGEPCRVDASAFALDRPHRLTLQECAHG